MVVDFLAVVGIGAAFGTIWYVFYNRVREREAFERADELWERLKEAEERYFKVEESLRKQIQDLSERLASIRIEHPGATSEQSAREDMEQDEPLSQALLSFLNGIEFEDARQLVEEEVYGLREQGYADDHILEIISGDE